MLRADKKRHRLFILAIRHTHQASVLHGLGMEWLGRPDIVSGLFSRIGQNTSASELWYSPPPTEPALPSSYRSAKREDKRT